MTTETKPIPILDLKAQYKQIKTEVLAAVEAVLERQAFILGREVETLETAKLMEQTAPDDQNVFNGRVHWCGASVSIAIFKRKPEAPRYFKTNTSSRPAARTGSGSDSDRSVRHWRDADKAVPHSVSSDRQSQRIGRLPIKC